MYIELQHFGMFPLAHSMVLSVMLQASLHLAQSLNGSCLPVALSVALQPSFRHSTFSTDRVSLQRLALNLSLRLLQIYSFSRLCLTVSVLMPSLSLSCSVCTGCVGRNSTSGEAGLAFLCSAVSEAWCGTSLVLVDRRHHFQSLCSVVLL